jgi:hypothetical protein
MNRSSKFTSRTVLVTVAGTLLSACSLTPATNTGPTFQDYLAIEDARHDYHYGLDTRDAKLKASAFTKDGRIVTFVEGKVSHVEYPNQPEKSSVSGVPAVPPAGSPSPAGLGGPVAGGPPPAAAGSQAPKGELWHLTYPAHLKFESATKATSYGYWTSFYSEAKGPRDSQIGRPGHYEDILEKQSDGRWLFVERKIMVGSKK